VKLAMCQLHTLGQQCQTASKKASLYQYLALKGQLTAGYLYCPWQKSVVAFIKVSKLLVVTLFASLVIKSVGVIRAAPAIEWEDILFVHACTTSLELLWNLSHRCYRSHMGRNVSLRFATLYCTFTDLYHVNR